jgi:hypothetical protein
MNKDIYHFYQVEDALSLLCSARVFTGYSKGVSQSTRYRKLYLTDYTPDILQSGISATYSYSRDEWTLDHASRSGNGDMSKVIATVAQNRNRFFGSIPGSATLI